jgi:hypothetical protein
MGIHQSTLKLSLLLLFLSPIAPFPISPALAQAIVVGNRVGRVGTSISFDIALSLTQKADDSDDIILSSPPESPTGQYDNVLPPSDDIEDLIHLEGIDLVREGTVESRKKAIIKFKQALELSKQAKRQHTQAMVLSSLARTYKKLGSPIT